MSQDFKPIFDYLDEMKAELKADIISAVDLKTDRIQNTLDSLTKDVNKFDQELTVQTHRVNKIEEWVKPAATKIQVPYSV